MQVNPLADQTGMSGLPGFGLIHLRHHHPLDRLQLWAAVKKGIQIACLLKCLWH